MNSVIKLTAMPPRDGIAIGCITSEPRPVAQKIGIRPKMVVEIVIRHGRIRFRPACSTASRISSTDLNVAVVEYAFEIGGDDHAVVVHHAEEHQEARPTPPPTDSRPTGQHDEAAGRGNQHAEVR